MRTDQEIVDRIRYLDDHPSDLLGTEASDLISTSPFEAAKPFLLDHATESSWVVASRDREDILRLMFDYMPFAWEKANSFRSISAARSLAHFSAWLWLIGENLGDLSTYEHYGKDHLRWICTHFGWDADLWDDGIRANDEMAYWARQYEATIRFRVGYFPNGTDVDFDAISAHLSRHVCVDYDPKRPVLGCEGMNARDSGPPTIFLAHIDWATLEECGFGGKKDGFLVLEDRPSFEERQAAEAKHEALLSEVEASVRRVADRAGWADATLVSHLVRYAADDACNSADLPTYLEEEADYSLRVAAIAAEEANNAGE